MYMLNMYVHFNIATSGARALLAAKHKQNNIHACVIFTIQR